MNMYVLCIANSKDASCIVYLNSMGMFVRKLK